MAYSRQEIIESYLREVTPIDHATISPEYKRAVLSDEWTKVIEESR